MNIYNSKGSIILSIKDDTLRRADLRGVDLRDADLRGIDLHGADLHGADLRGAVLSFAVLRHVTHKWTDISGNDLDFLTDDKTKFLKCSAGIDKG